MMGKSQLDSKSKMLADKAPKLRITGSYSNIFFAAQYVSLSHIGFAACLVSSS